MLHLKNYFSVSEQQNLVEITRNIFKTNGGMIIPMKPNGKRFNCSQTSCGLAGWLSDGGFAARYSPINPINNQPFPLIPTELVEIGQSLAKLVGEFNYQPETCLINYYPANTKSRQDLHQDNTEPNLKTCVISISLGDDCSFVIGSKFSRKDPLKGIMLRSGPCPNPSRGQPFSLSWSSKNST